MSDLKLILTRKGVAIKKSKPVQTKSNRFTSEKYLNEKSDNLRMKEMFQIYWSNLSDARSRANRVYEYYIGNQWNDTMTVVDKYGKQQTMTEYDFIVSNGRIPFVQNIMQPIGRNIIGQFEINPLKSIVKARNREDQKVSDKLSSALDEAITNNSMEILEPRQLELFLNSGFIVTDTRWEYMQHKDRSDVKFRMINYNNVAFNNFSDPRGDGLTFVGEIIDPDIGSLVSTFARTQAEEESIRNMYPVTGANSKYINATSQTGTGDEQTNISFDSPVDASLCRVYAVWEKRGEWRMLEHDYLNGTLKVTKRTQSQIDAENNERILFCISNGVEPDEKLHLIEGTKRYEQYWFYKYLTPYGDCLEFGESPYEHQSHPYTITVHPYLNGRIWSFMESMIDSQRQVNRLLSLQDAILGGVAKNLLVIPASTLESERSDDREQIQEEYGKINGTVVLDMKPGQPIPQQISGSAASLGIPDMVNSYISSLINISGVSPAAQGQQAKSGTPSSLYAQEAQYSQINIRDVMNSFMFHKQQRDIKALSLIRQYKADGEITSNRSNREDMMYSSQEAKNIRGVDVTVTQATDTPLYRSLMDDKLSNFVDKGFIDLKMYAELSSESWAEPLLELINKRETEMKEGQQQQPITPEQVAQLQGIRNQIQAGDNRSISQQELVAQALGMGNKQ